MHALEWCIIKLGKIAPRCVQLRSPFTVAHDSLFVAFSRAFLGRQSPSGCVQCWLPWSVPQSASGPCKWIPRLCRCLLRCARLIFSWVGDPGMGSRGPQGVDPLSPCPPRVASSILPTLQGHAAEVEGHRCHPQLADET